MCHAKGIFMQHNENISATSQDTFLNLVIFHTLCAREADLHVPVRNASTAKAMFHYKGRISWNFIFL